jgi:hypothetical protein
MRSDDCFVGSHFSAMKGGRVVNGCAHSLVVKDFSKLSIKSAPKQRHFALATFDKSARL